MHTVDPVEDAYKPIGQVVHVVAPAALNLPWAHAAQTLAPEPLKKPAEQLMHTIEPEELYVPGAQLPQLDAAEMATNLPAAHNLQAAKPVTSAYFPASQLEQLAEPTKL